MRLLLRNPALACLAGVLILLPFLYGETATTQPFQTQIVLSNPCAVFAASTGSTSVTRITYGESITFAISGTVQSILDKDGGQMALKFQVNAHGDGTGATSGIKYQFNAKEVLKASTGTNLESFNGSFRLDTRIIGQGNAASVSQIAQGAQDNAILHFSMDIRYTSGQTVATASQFVLECAASPWTNQMESPAATTKTGVGRGFGDPWNKYAWSLKDFNGGLIVGTKSAFFNYASIINPSAAMETCMDTPSMFPEIYMPLACLELVGDPFAVGTRNADIWRYDYVTKDWTQMLHDTASQGFRIMEIHNGKLYAGSDLGSFITGVQLYSASPTGWPLPGSRLLVSSDGKTFLSVPCPGTPAGPCSTGTGFPGDPTLNVNTSFRALASYDGKLYLGTFNYSGAELWAYSDTTEEWTLVKKWSPAQPAISELRVYKNQLYIGFAGTSDYLWTYDTVAEPAVLGPAPTLPADLPDPSLGVIKLFVAKNLLYVGNVDLNNGFSLHTYDGSDWKTVTVNGFYNPDNAYAWSMAEVGGRVFVGTFNKNFLTDLPRGSAELWFTDDNVNWQQAPLPLNWGLWNYGIRTMELANGGKTLYFGTASNMVAPDLIPNPIPLGPGLEIWSMQATAAVKQ